MSTEKVFSKYYRIRMSEQIHNLVEALPLKGMKETQVGNHVYSGSGFLCVGETKYPVTLRIRLVDGSAIVHMTSPSLLLNVTCSFEDSKIHLQEALETAARLQLN
jgi:hypothetical protein